MNCPAENIDKFRYPCGIGGWLLIPIYVIFLQVFLQGKNFATQYIPTVFSSNFLCYFNSDYDIFSPTYGLLVLVEMLMSVFLGAWGLLCLYLVLKRSTATRIWCSRYFFFIVAYTVLDNVVATICIPDFRMFTDEYSFVVFVVSIGNPLLWGLYFLKSSRVSRTFNTGKVETVQSVKVSEEVELHRSVLLLRRFAARTFDMIVVLFLIILLGKATSKIRSSLGLEWTLLVHLRWLVICDLMIYALFQQTPGKKLFGLQVLRNDDQVLTRKQYMFRSGNALFYLCWPIWMLYSTVTMRYFWMMAAVSLCATFGFQYCKVLKSGRTSYDSVYDTKVAAQPLTSKQKAIVAVVFFLVISLLIAVVYA